MERICYSPSEDELSDAETLAEGWGVSIQVGESQRTAALDFDRDLVQILQIPTEQYLDVDPKKVRINQCVSLKYVDEFTNVKGVRVEHTLAGMTEEAMPLWKTLAHVREYRIRLAAAGKCEIRVFDEDGTIATDVVEVLPW
jgi:hypothetical protein